MRTVTLLLCFSGILAAPVSKVAAQTETNDPGGFRRQLRASEIELKLDTLEPKALVEYLGHDRFFWRESAHRELRKRGNAAMEALLEGTAHDQLEVRVRVDALLQALFASYLRKECGPIEIEATVTDPRFWQGNNQHLGGRFDESLDGNLNLNCSKNVLRVLSPIDSVSGRTDSGEHIGAQLWSRQLQCPPSLSLYLNRPKRSFRTIELNLSVLHTVRIVDKVNVSLKEGETTLRKDCTTLQVVRKIETDSKEQFYTLTITDKLGRLCTPAAEPYFTLSNGKALKASTQRQYSTYRRSWTLRAPAELTIECQLTLDTGECFLRTPVKTSINHPPK